MDKKKYFIVMPPGIIIGIFLLFYLPERDRTYVGLIPIIFWIIYYSWIYIEKRKKRD